MTDVPDPSWGFSPDFSISLPDTDKTSLDSVQLHELAILRERAEPAPTSITFIRMYLNKQHRHNWTDDQILRVWRTLRKQFETEETIQEGHPLYIWSRENDLDRQHSKEKAELLKEMISTTLQEFFEVLSSELEDSSIDMDIAIERKAVEDDVEVLTSVQSRWGGKYRKAWTPAVKALYSFDEGPTIFKHPDSAKTTEEKVEDWNEEKKLRDELFKAKQTWKRDVLAGRATLADKPSKFDEKYKFRPQLAKSLR
ncbi:MAG: hypothetical protein Q9182_005343 [Xanthomendoza sp. 2 TL-2023]